MLKKLRSSLTVQYARMIYQSMIVPLMTYYDIVTLNLYNHGYQSLSIWKIGQRKLLQMD
jgi:hypothetical protein